MQHIAIMKKSSKLIDKIVPGDKTIESRWSKTKRAPFGRIGVEDIIYFKDSGNPVTAMAEVEKVLQFRDLTSELIDHILKTYGKELGIEYAPGLHRRYAGKKYCILAFLRNPRRIKPFSIDKTGYGIGSAWICVDDVAKIRTN